MVRRQVKWEVVKARKEYDCYSGQQLDIGDHALVAVHFVNEKDNFNVWVEIEKFIDEKYSGLVRFPACNRDLLAAGESDVRCEFGSVNIECAAKKVKAGALLKTEQMIKQRLGETQCECCGRPQVELFWENMKEICTFAEAKDRNDLLTLLTSNPALSEIVREDVYERTDNDVLRGSFDYFIQCSIEAQE
jgi:hypothetical protein